MLARLQTEGNTTFGLSQALFEEMVFDGGQLVGANLGDYMITSIKDLPTAIEIDVVANDDDEVMHGLGETSLPTVMAAIGNAVARATGVRITDLPITPEKVLRALRAAEAPDGPPEGSDA
jgi:CO/xanthine dehydrogenase Mo-binding subunit